MSSGVKVLGTNSSSISGTSASGMGPSSLFFTYLFLVARGLCCYAWPSLAVCVGFSCCRARAQELWHRLRSSDTGSGAVTRAQEFWCGSGAVIQTQELWHGLRSSDVAQEMWHRLRSCDMDSGVLMWAQELWHGLRSCDTASGVVTWAWELWHGLRSSDVGSGAVTWAQELWHGLRSCDMHSGVVAHGFSCSEVCVIFSGQGSNLCLLHW